MRRPTRPGPAVLNRSPVAVACVDAWQVPVIVEALEGAGVKATADEVGMLAELSYLRPQRPPRVEIRVDAGELERARGALAWLELSAAEAVHGEAPGFEAKAPAREDKRVATSRVWWLAAAVVALVSIAVPPFVRARQAAEEARRPLQGDANAPAIRAPRTTALVESELHRAGLR